MGARGRRGELAPGVRSERVRRAGARAVRGRRRGGLGISWRGGGWQIGSRGGDLDRWRAVRPARQAAPAGADGRPSTAAWAAWRRRRCGGSSMAGRSSMGSVISDSICSGSCWLRYLATAVDVYRCCLDGSGGWAWIRGKLQAGVAAAPKSTPLGADSLPGGFGVDPAPPTSAMSTGESLCSSVWATTAPWCRVPS